MQSYTIYKVSEFLKDRHPYMPPKNERPLQDPEQVAIAYNERAIPKLADLLKYPDLSSQKRKETLHTLNELVSHQETKAEMIRNNIVLSATNLMEDESEEVRCEAAKLVGSLFFLDIGRSQFDLREGNYTILHNLIFDNLVNVRECVGWMLCRLSIHKDGISMMYRSGTIIKIVEAFNKFSSSHIEENYKFLFYLLDSIMNLSMYDFGIKHMLNKGLLKTYNQILLDKDYYYRKNLAANIYEQMNELILITLKNIVLIDDGKIEAMNEDLIETISSFLNSQIDIERFTSSSFMMSISNNLEAKKMICNYTKKSGNNYEILERICVLLEDKNEEVKNNSILALKLLSQFPSGFLRIVDILHEKLKFLDEVFGTRALNGICELLPNLNKYKNPPHVDKEMIPKYSKYIRGIIYYLKKYKDESLEILIHETPNIAEKLGPFLLINDTLIYKHVEYILSKIFAKDNHNKQVLQKFFEHYNEKSKNLNGSESLHLSDLN